MGRLDRGRPCNARSSAGQHTYTAACCSWPGRAERRNHHRAHAHSSRDGRGRHCRERQASQHALRGARHHQQHQQQCNPSQQRGPHKVRRLAPPAPRLADHAPRLGLSTRFGGRHRRGMSPYLAMEVRQLARQLLGSLVRYPPLASAASRVLPARAPIHTAGRGSPTLSMASRSSAVAHSLKPLGCQALLHRLPSRAWREPSSTASSPRAEPLTSSCRNLPPS